jgi:hypothetical protein
MIICDINLNRVFTLDKELINFLNVTLPVITGLGGAFIAGYFTRKGQKEVLRIEIQRERIKEKQRETIETLEIYSRILRIDGEKLLITFGGGGAVEFDIEGYQQNIRPIIYEKFYLIEQGIADQVRSLDNNIEKCNFQEEASDEDHKEFANLYWSIINKVEMELLEYRAAIKAFNGM